jgi:hypothetical protein
MTWRTKIKSSTVACDRFLEILHLSHLLKADDKGDAKVVEG